jgi:hypothetical protein
LGAEANLGQKVICGAVLTRRSGLTLRASRSPLWGSVAVGLSRSLCRSFHF